MTDNLEHNAADYSGVVRTFLEVVENFRAVAIENDRDSGTGPLADLNDHFTGPVQPQHLSSVPAFPVAWSVPMNYAPNYASTRGDKGNLQFQVVTWAKNQDMTWALEDAMIYALAVVDNLENDPALSDGPNDVPVGKTTWTNLDLDFAPRGAQGNQPQLRFAMVEFDVQLDRTVTW